MGDEPKKLAPHAFKVAGEMVQHSKKSDKVRI